MQNYFIQVLILLGAAVSVVMLFQRLRIPSSMGYLLVGVWLGPYTPGPHVDDQQLRVLAEFGIVFLLFTIGLNFSLTQIRALRNQVLGLGTGQVVLTTAIVGFIAWLAGLPVATAFVVGAVFAQSSTTIISKQLVEQNEENSRHGRLGLAMSVFQDVTAVPFVVIIPVLGSAVGAAAIGGALGLALAKALLALAAVLIAGKWLLRPLFHLVSQARSAELFTLTVLLVSLVPAWVTDQLGLSMAFGAFLAGMMLGETEFRHQVESTIRPFRDVLLGLFFIGIGTLFDPLSVTAIWHWALLGTLVLLISKIIIVAQIVRWSGVDRVTAWRTGMLLGVGGEFGFALLAIALGNDVIATHIGQIALTSVLFSMILAPFLIRYNQPLAKMLSAHVPQAIDAPKIQPETIGPISDHVIICGYGRIGQSVGNFLEEEHIRFVALDLDPTRVKLAHTAGEPVFYGDAAERDMLEALGIERARLLVISHEDTASALKILHHARQLRDDLPILVRTRDETHVEALRNAGATEVVPETLEASLMIASQILLTLGLAPELVIRRMQEQRAKRYRLLRELFKGDRLSDQPGSNGTDQLRPVSLPQDTPLIGKPLGELTLPNVLVTALVREGQRHLNPDRNTQILPEDVLVLFGCPEDLDAAETLLLKPGE